MTGRPASAGRPVWLPTPGAECAAAAALRGLVDIRRIDERCCKADETALHPNPVTVSKTVVWGGIGWQFVAYSVTLPPRPESGDVHRGAHIRVIFSGLPA